MAGAGKLISVIVPVYKAEAYLKRCVDSLIGQECAGADMEIILVDDGSPDGCPAMCDAFAKGDGRIRVVHKENGGLVSAWQAGVRASRGEYLGFVDSDDWVETDMLRNMAAYLSGVEGETKGDKGRSEEKNAEERTEKDVKKDAREIICCNFVINRPDKETEHYHGLAAGVYEGRQLEGEIKDNLLGHENRRISMSRCMKLFSRSLIEENMKYCNPKVTMGEDVNITLAALLDCRRVVIMEDALYYHYFYNDASMVHHYDAGMYEGIRTLYRTIKEIYRIKGRENGESQANREYVYLLLLALKNEIRGGADGYGERVRQICRDAENRRIVGENPVKVSDKTNRMLYFILRHPVRMVIVVARMVFWVYDSRRMRRERNF